MKQFNLNHMKQFLLLFLAVTMFSCSDDDNASIQDEFLIGEWKATSFTREEDDAVFDLSTCDNFPEIKYHMNWLFFRNSTYSFMEIVTNTCDDEFTEAVARHFNYNDGTLTVTIPESTGGNNEVEFIAHIEKLSDTKLSVEWPTKGIFILEKQP